MTSLAVLLDQYLAMRRSFGYDLSTSGRILRRFVNFAEMEGIEHVSTALFLRWKESFGSANESTWAARLVIVRLFAVWLQTMNSQHAVPPAGLVSGRMRRPRPYIYTDEEVVQIVATAATLTSDYGLRGSTCSTALGLMAVTGLRISEAIGLDDRDLDLQAAVVVVRQGKNGKSRSLPITTCTTERLLAYQRLRNRFGRPDEPQFFQWDDGRRPTDCGLRYHFARVCQQIGLRKPQTFQKHGRGPRIHDLRHTFAVRTILRWYREGLDPDREMSKLTAYLGHTVPEHTYWYIEAVPELLQLAVERSERSLKQAAVR